MSFDRDALIQACAAHGVVTRIVVAAVRGSAPREVGAAMLVWAQGQSGTIGGGTLEHEMTVLARETMEIGAYRLSRHALGPDMGQCCGGAVELVSETFDVAHAEALPSDIVARGIGSEPLSITRLKTISRNANTPLHPQLVEGWMVEPAYQPTRDIWVWGAGHVGRALVTVFAPLPGVKITWVDTDDARFPADCPDNVSKITAQNPADLAPYAPETGEHLIVTYSHALDLELCHQLLNRGFHFVGLIGSKTKWARFRKRLAALGHLSDQIERITCPIGSPVLGKHPHTIAIGVASSLLHTATSAPVSLEKSA
jgi:xanthine dehydrogenase accessory factor